MNEDPRQRSHPRPALWIRWLPIGACLACATLAPGLRADDPGKPWTRHVIDNSSRGADGVRLADVNGDGRLDIVTGWEEGGVTRICVNPGPAAAKAKWPSVTVGTTPSTEDAVLVDLDGDGALDVVSSCEGKTRTLFVHWAPRERRDYLNPGAWQTESIPASRGRMMWMFALSGQIDGQNGVDFFAGGKGNGAELGWWEAPPQPRQLADWKWHPLRPVGWLMSLASSDMDGDGDADLVFTDRKGQSSGCFWLENPGRDFPPAALWKEHSIGGAGKEVMFLALADLDQDGLEDVAVATRPSEVLLLRRQNRQGDSWRPHSVSFPANTGGAKGISAGDIDGDGRLDLVLTCEHAEPPKSGVFWLSNSSTPWESAWEPHKISGPEGVKFDLVQLLDLDGDGDLDVITCEERQNLGVIWYENPAK